MTSRAYYLTTLEEWQRQSPRLAQSHWVALAGAPGAGEGAGAGEILALVEADEGVHLALERHPGFQPLPHPLSAKPVPPEVAAKLAALGAAPGANTFDIAEAAAAAHPLLRHRVF
jgi:hypothetical protein